MSSVLSRHFIDIFDANQKNNVKRVEIDSDCELENKFSDCLEKGHICFKHDDLNNCSYGHICKTCGKYFHRHICLGGRGSSIGKL
jgi:hypothetical protein